MGIGRRQFLAGSAITLVSKPAYAFVPVLGLFARSLVSSGARGLSQSTVRSAVQTGMQRAGRSASGQPARNLSAELTRGLSLRGISNAPVWHAGSRNNRVQVNVSTHFAVNVDIPVVINIVDLDTGQIEERLTYSVPIPFGRFESQFVVRHPFYRVEVGRKAVHAHVSAQVGVTVETTPLVLVV